MKYKELEAAVIKKYSKRNLYATKNIKIELDSY